MAKPTQHITLNINMYTLYGLRGLLFGVTNTVANLMYTVLGIIKNTARKRILFGVKDSQIIEN